MRAEEWGNSVDSPAFILLPVRFGIRDEDLWFPTDSENPRAGDFRGLPLVQLMPLKFRMIGRRMKAEEWGDLVSFFCQSDLMTMVALDLRF